MIEGLGKRLVICTPTCNRPDIIEDVLRYEVNYYPDFSFDITYYDSSNNDDTKIIVEQYIDRFGGKINYIRTEYNQCLDYKLMEILKGIDKYKYDYIWFIGDSISIREEAMPEILSLLNEKPDLIRLSQSGEDKKDVTICTDCQEWFESCSASMAHMVSTIMSTSLLKVDTDWEELGEKYIGNNELNENHGYFFTVGFYLEQILKLKNFKGIKMGNTVKWRHDSVLKGSRSYWKDNLFDVWIRSYCETILRLPSEYKNKESVIKRSENIINGRFSEEMMKRYRAANIYDLNQYYKYEKYWQFVTEVKEKTLLNIAETDVAFYQKDYGDKPFDEGVWVENLSAIKKRYAEMDVIVYGAGLYGERVISEVKHWPNALIGVAVTNKCNNVDIIDGIPVYEISELESHKENALVIIATLPAIALDIKHTLKIKKFKYIASLF